MTILYLEPIPYAQHQFFCAWELCSGALLVGLSMIVNYSSGCADCSEPVVGEYITAETWVGSGGEGLERRNVLFDSYHYADVHHTPELVKEL